MVGIVFLQEVLSVTVPPPLTVTPISPTVCTGKTLTLTALGANTYTWYAPPGATSIANTNTVAVSPSAGPITYTVKGGGTGCVYTKTTQVIATRLSRNRFHFYTIYLPWSGPNNTNCLGYRMANSLTPLPYNPLAEFRGTVAISATATAVHTVMAKSIQGCINTSTFLLTVKPNPTVTAIATPRLFVTALLPI